jgi:hypothetical protein
MTDIDVLLSETRSFPPPAEFQRQALVNDRALHQEGDANYEKYWARQAADLHWITPPSRARLEAPARQVVHRRPPQRLGQLSGPAPQRPAPQQGRDRLGG